MLWYLLIYSLCVFTNKINISQISQSIDIWIERIEPMDTGHCGSYCQRPAFLLILSKISVLCSSSDLTQCTPCCQYEKYHSCGNRIKVPLITFTATHQSPPTTQYQTTLSIEYLHTYIFCFFPVFVSTSENVMFWCFFFWGKTSFIIISYFITLSFFEVWPPDVCLK